MEKDITKEILRKFLYDENLEYNKIWDKKLCSSSHFDYYLKKLISEGLIKKENEIYNLTNEGYSLISSIDGKEVKQKKLPTTFCFMLLDNNGKFVMNEKKTTISKLL